MNNFTSMFVAILEQLELLTKDEAQNLIKDLHGTTLPDTYEGATTMVKNLFIKHGVRVKKVETMTETEVAKIAMKVIEPFIEQFKVKPKTTVDTPKP